MSYKIVDTCIGCTACSKRCPTNAISGERKVTHVIDPELCIDCGACGVVCPVECILDDQGDVCRKFTPKEFPKAIVIEDNCIGSGCELCISICPFDALYLDTSAEKVGDFFGVATVVEKRCTGCRLCEQVCGWNAVYVDPPRETLKKRLHPSEESAEELAAVDTAPPEHEA